ncbi:MAG: hypothetical protein AAB489_04210, partial [Patescibacteria group bacterium]
MPRHRVLARLLLGLLTTTQILASGILSAFPMPETLRAEVPVAHATTETETFFSSNDPFSLLGFTHTKALEAGLSGFDLNGSAMNYDSVTANKICQLAEYQSAKSINDFACCGYGDNTGFTSPGDNTLVRWNGNQFVNVNASTAGNRWIASVTCERTVTTQCSDGVDNDNDGATDYPNDFSCSSATDNDETNPKPACKDGIDNDNDGDTDYLDDAGCQNNQDNDELPVAKPILSITKFGTPNAQIGDTPLFSVLVSNEGGTNGADAGNVVVKDVLDSRLTFASQQSSNWCQLQGGNTVVCTIPSLPTHDELTASIYVTVNSSAHCGDVITNKASVEAANYSPALQSLPVSLMIVCGQCGDGVDNDNDGATDYPNDF